MRVHLPLRRRSRETETTSTIGEAPGINEMGGDALLADHHWLALVEDCILLYDELAEHGSRLDANSRVIAEHVCDRLREILERSQVTIIEGDATFDPQRHRIIPPSSGAQPGATLAGTSRPGFAIGPRVVRRADVTIAEAHSQGERDDSPGSPSN